MDALTEQEKPRLLFVDDEQRVLNSMRIMFRRKFDLYLASHGAEALDIVRERNIDVIVADHRMPQMTGVEVLTTSLNGPLCGRVGNWDDHAVNHHVFDGMRFRAQAYDQAVTALIEDIYERGLDKRVLVVVTGTATRCSTSATGRTSTARRSSSW